MKQLLIFDLDGTLVDCKQLHRDAFIQAIGNKWYPEERVEGLPTLDKIAILNDMGYELDKDKVSKHKQELTFYLFDDYIHYSPELNKLLSVLENASMCSSWGEPNLQG